MGRAKRRRRQSYRARLILYREVVEGRRNSEIVGGEPVGEVNVV
jgi:hypothetical protein